MHNALMNPSVEVYCFSASPIPKIEAIECTAKSYCIRLIFVFFLHLLFSIPKETHDGKMLLLELS